MTLMELQAYAYYHRGLENWQGKPTHELSEAEICAALGWAREHRNGGALHRPLPKCTEN